MENWDDSGLSIVIDWEDSNFFDASSKSVAQTIGNDLRNFPNDENITLQ